MAEEKGNSSMSGAVWGAIAGSVATVVAGAVLGWVPGAWAWLGGVVGAAWGHLVARSYVPNWLMYAALATLAWRALASASSHWRMRDSNHQRFKQLTMLGGVWRWEYISGAPTNLRVYCPRCDGALVYSEEWEYETSLRRKIVQWHCERCNTNCVRHAGTRDYLNDRIYREVDRLLRTGDWRRHVPETGRNGAKSG